MTNDDAYFDGLAKADFIGKQVARDGIVEYPARDGELVREDLDVRRREAGEATVHRPLLGEAADQSGTAFVPEGGLGVASLQ